MIIPQLHNVDIEDIKSFLSVVAEHSDHDYATIAQCGY